MERRITDKNVYVVYAAVLVLGVAYGISIALTALFLDARGFGKTDIGQLAAVFALGIVATSFPAAWLVRRFSAKTTFVLAAVGYAGCVAAFPHADSFGGIATIRFFDGACSVLVWVSAETMLLARSSAKHKAFVMSLYAICLAVGYVVGPLGARFVVQNAPIHMAFAVSGVLALVASLIAVAGLDKDAAGAGVSVRHADEEAGVVRAASDTALTATAIAGARYSQLLLRIKTSCFATFAYGYFQASVVLFLPLFLIEKKGIAADRTILVPAYFAAGMLLFSNIAGRLGDKRGHLAVMRVQAAIGLAMIVGFVSLHSYGWMCVAVFVAGATLAAISPVSLALQGLVVAPGDYARANGIYNAFYALGMLAGPPLSSVLYARRGGEVMLLHLAALWALFVVFTWIFRKDDPAQVRRSQSHDAALSLSGEVAMTGEVAIGATAAVVSVPRRPA